MKRLVFATVLLAGLAWADDVPTGFWLSAGGAVFTGNSHQTMGYGPSVETGIFLPPLETRMFLSSGFQMHINSVTIKDSAYDSNTGSYIVRENSVSIKEIPIMLGIGTFPHRSRWFGKLAAGMHVLLISGMPENSPSMQWSMGLKSSAGYSWGNGIFFELGAGYILDKTFGYIYPFGRLGFLVAKGD